MIIGRDWTLVSSGEVLLQHSDSELVSLCYATTTPTTEDDFALIARSSVTFPRVANLNLYARINKDSAVLTVVQGATNSTAARFAEGRAYTAMVEDTLLDNDVFSVCIETGAELITASDFITSTTSIETKIDFFENSTFNTDGVDLVPINRNRNFKSVLLPLTSMQTEPTITDIGDLLFTYFVYGTAGGGKNSNTFGEFGDELQHFILEPNTGYTIRITNFGGDTRAYRVTLNMFFGEG